MLVPEHSLRLAENLHKSEETDQCRHGLNATHGLHVSIGKAIETSQVIHANTAEEESEEDREQALEQVLGNKAGHNTEAKETHCKVFRRSEGKRRSRYAFGQDEQDYA